MTIKEAAKELNVSGTTVRNWITKGLLKATKVRYGMRKTYSITKTDLNEFVKQHLND